MDIYCTRCAEPYDINHLHDVVRSENLTYRSPTTGTDQPHTFDTLYADFTRRGCVALGEPQSSCVPHPAANPLRELAELAGDDIEFFASMCEDLL